MPGGYAGLAATLAISGRKAEAHAPASLSPIASCSSAHSSPTRAPVVAGAGRSLPASRCRSSSSSDDSCSSLDSSAPRSSSRPCRGVSSGPPAPELDRETWPAPHLLLFHLARAALLSLRPSGSIRRSWSGPAGFARRGPPPGTAQRCLRSPPPRGTSQPVPIPWSPPAPPRSRRRAGP